MMERSERKKTAVIWTVAPLAKFTEIREDVITLFPPSASEGACASEVPYSLSFIRLSINLPSFSHIKQKSHWPSLLKGLSGGRYTETLKMTASWESRCMFT